MYVCMLCVRMGELIDMCVIIYITEHLVQVKTRRYSASEAFKLLNANALWPLGGGTGWS